MNIQKEKEELLKTRKGNTMKNSITRVDALNFAIETINGIEAYEADVAKHNEIAAVLTSIRDSIAKQSQTSDAAKAKRKEQTAAKRAEMCANVVPILREVITHDMTAKEIFAAAQERLPADFTAPKVQNILLREMKDELVKTEAKGKPNVYKMKD